MYIFGDMNKNVSHRLIGLPTGGDVCKEFGYVALLDKVCYWSRTSSLKPHTIPVCSLLTDCAEEIPLSSELPAPAIMSAPCCHVVLAILDKNPLEL